MDLLRNMPASPKMLRGTASPLPDAQNAAASFHHHGADDLQAPSEITTTPLRQAAPDPMQTPPFRVRCCGSGFKRDAEKNDNVKRV